MAIDNVGVRNTLAFFVDLRLLDSADATGILWLLGPANPFFTQRAQADSIHVHVKVADTDRLPDGAIRNGGGSVENRRAGYVKYVFPAGVNLIFSSIPVAEDDRLPDARPVARATLDHVGFDLRSTAVDVRRAFDAVAKAAAGAGWQHLSQGGGGRAVYCCHTQVAEKHWVYPPCDLRAWSRPVEFAFGPLVVDANSMGCDLRPSDPESTRMAGASACCATPESCR